MFSDLQINDKVQVHSALELDGKTGIVGGFIGDGNYIAIVIWDETENDLARLMPVTCLRKTS